MKVNLNNKVSHIIKTFNLEIERCKLFREKNDWINLTGRAKAIASNNDLTISVYESVLLESLEVLNEINAIDLSNKSFNTQISRLDTFNKFIDNCNQVDWTLGVETDGNDSILEELELFNEEINTEVEIKKKYIKEIKEIIKDMYTKLATRTKKFTLKGEEKPDELVEAMMKGEI